MTTQKNDQSIPQKLTKENLEARTKNLVNDTPDSKLDPKKHAQLLVLAECAIKSGEDGVDVFRELMVKPKYKATEVDWKWEDPEENQNRTYDTGILDQVKVYYDKEVQRQYLGSQEDKNKLMQIALDNKNIPVINLIMQQGYRPTHEQFETYAHMVVDTLGLDKDLKAEFIIKIKPFFTKLHELENKIEDLNKRGFPDEAKMAAGLSNNLRYAIMDFVDKDKPASYFNANAMIERCEDHIQNVKPSLETHRGWAPFFEELLGVMTCFLSKIVTLIATGGEWSLTDIGVIKTDTEKVLKNMSDTFKTMKAELMSLKKPEPTEVEQVNDSENNLTP